MSLFVLFLGGGGAGPPPPPSGGGGTIIAQCRAMSLKWNHQMSDGLFWAYTRVREPIKKGEDPSLGRRYLAGWLSFEAPQGWGDEEGWT